MRQADILASGGGGVTFSGGEPLLQAGFVAEVIDLLGGMHVVLDTSGYAAADVFGGGRDAVRLALLRHQAHRCRGAPALDGTGQWADPDEP